MSDTLFADIVALRPEFAECATEMSQRLKDAELLLVDGPCFTFLHTDYATLRLEKVNGAWQLTIAVDEANGVPVTTASVREKYFALKLLPKFLESYKQEMKVRIEQMNALLYPRGKCVAAKE